MGLFCPEKALVAKVVMILDSPNIWNLSLAQHVASSGTYSRLIHNTYSTLFCSGSTHPCMDLTPENFGY